MSIHRYTDETQARERYIKRLETRIQRVKDELCDAIDGGEECRGRDSQLSRWIAILDGEIGL